MNLLPLPPLAAIDWPIIVMFFFIFGGSGFVLDLIKNINKTRVELAELRAQQLKDAATQQEVAALREEMNTLKTQVESLRDTTTQYDLSFDTALQRMEQRVNHLEQQPQQQRIGLS
jgi:septal ring factor EnvC (AmiA/AmiB activator)